MRAGGLAVAEYWWSSFSLFFPGCTFPTRRKKIENCKCQHSRKVKPAALLVSYTDHCVLFVILHAKTQNKTLLANVRAALKLKFVEDEFK
jgi:hypothetical protein